jgi:hypothetical protein
MNQLQSSSVTLRWRRQSAANSSRKWSLESWGSDGKMDPFPKRSTYLSDCYYSYFSNAGIAVAADFPVYQRKLIFPSIKERGGSTRSKFVQNGRLFSQLRFKAHNIGGLGHDYQSGILWSAYPMKLWALVPCRHRMQKKHAETRPQETPHHPERLTRSTRNEGPSVVL